MEIVLSRTKSSPRLTGWQVRKTRLVVAWYLEHHYGRGEELGTREMYADPTRVGRLAVDPGALSAGLPTALFRVLVATAMFQRIRDSHVTSILRGLSPRVAREVGSLNWLAREAGRGVCDRSRTTELLRESCDLMKDPDTGEGTCGVAPGLACHLKSHTVALRRYGHFGKVPSSLALAVKEAGATDLRALQRRVLRETTSPLEAAYRLEADLSRAWRVNKKISSMFLSVVSNPDLGGTVAPWQEGLDWSYFVVIDSNVDLFLSNLGYEGPWTYGARRSFVKALAERISLDELRPGLSAYNPRIVQQAMYLFKSTGNRRALATDCHRGGAEVCGACPPALRTMCALREA